MRMKKWKTGLVLMSLLLVFTSLPVSAAEIEEQDVLKESTQGDEILSENQKTESEDTVGTENEEQAEEEKGFVQEETISDTYVNYDLESEDVEVRIKGGQTEYIYTGSEIKPEIEIIHRPKDDSTESILALEHYTIEYQNNTQVGEASVILTGEDEEEKTETSEEKTRDIYTGTKTLNFKITPANIAACQIQMTKTVGYTGKQVKPAVVLTYQGNILTAGKDYNLAYSNNKKMGTAAVTIKGIGNFTGVRTEQFTIKLAAPSAKASANYSKIKIKWNKVKKANGYQVYRSTSPKSKFKKVKTYTSASKISYSDTKAKFNKTYYYKVRAYQKIKVKGKTKILYSPWSTVVSAKKKLGATTIKSAKCVSATSAKVTWKKTTGASGYEIYKCETKNGTYTYAGTATGGSKTSCTVKKLKAGVKYYFKVRAYRKSGSNKCYGAFSSVKKETITADQRLYYLFPDGVPTTKAQMERYLVTITVPIKDENGIPSTMQLRVHKNLTKEFMGAFLDMYAIGFPVRAEDTDTYNWRSMASGKNRSHHSYGCVVDLNWNSNPMIGVTDGKYRPGVDPYSVTPEVVAIWKKHGFYWGGDWKSTKDYMHFTYTNH